MERIMAVFRKYPIIPSMMTYSVLYPSANFVQQKYFRKFQSGEEKIDWQEIKR